MFEEENIFAKAGLDEMEEKIVEAEKQKGVSEGTGEQGVKTSDVFSPEEKKTDIPGNQVSVKFPEGNKKLKSSKKVSETSSTVEKGTHLNSIQNGEEMIHFQVRSFPKSYHAYFKKYCFLKGISFSECLVEMMINYWDVMSKFISENSGVMDKPKM